MRQYEKSQTGRAQRPIFSAYQGKRTNITGKEDQRLFGEHSEANQKIQREKKLRMSLNRESIKNVLNESPDRREIPTNNFMDNQPLQVAR